MPEKMSRRETSRSKSSTRRTRSITQSPVRRHSKSTDRKRERSNLRSRSRSRTPRKYRSKVSTSRSRSISPYNRRKGYSRSPHSDRRRHVGTRENPHQSRCIGIFGLSVYTDERKVREIFSKFGPIERIQVVIDAKTGRSRGFCFVYFDDVVDAKVAKEQCSGMEVDGRRIRVDYSITQRPHTPTPGVYMGRPTRHYKEREYHDKYRNGGRSPSPYRRRRYDRSRSRSRYERTRSRSISPRERKRERRYRY